jgi:cleavage stimulation factor subunit 3
MAKAKPLYAYFHKYEAQFGDLNHMLKYEKRMAELFPEDPKLANFSARYATDKFDPVAARIIISPAAQLKPKLGLGVLPSVEQPTSVQNSPRPGLRVQNSPRLGLIAATNSPKRPLPVDDLDDSYPPRKALRGDGEFQRGASPLKGAAGRRLDQQRKQGGTTTTHSAAPAPIARDITFLLSQIPPAHTYNSHTFNPAAVVRLLQETAVPDYSTWNRRQEGATGNVIATHDRPSAGAFGSLTGRARDSPAPIGVLGSGQPLSPYTGGGSARLPTAAATYGPPPGAYRPSSSGEYEPPPSVSAYPPPSFAAPPPQIQSPYGAPPPPELGGWAPPPQYGAPPPQVQPPPGQFGVYGAPPGMGGYQPPQPPPGQFGGAYRY